MSTLYVSICSISHSVESHYLPSIILASVVHAKFHSDKCYSVIVILPSIILLSGVMLIVILLAAMNSLSSDIVILLIVTLLSA
jgi:hypothetical protein